MKNRKLALGIVILLWSGTTLAQGFRVGVDAVGLFPTGNFAKTYGIGLGGLLRLEALSAAGVAVTFRSGYIEHLTKTATADNEGRADVKLDEVPILLGAKLYSHVGLYGALEIGGTSTRVTTSIAQVTISDTSFYASAALGIGFLVGPIDLQLSFRSLDLGNVADTLAFGVSLGINVISL